MDDPRGAPRLTMPSRPDGDFPVFDPPHAPDLRRSSPHLLDRTAFARQFGGSDRRRALLDGLDRRLRSLGGAGVTVGAVMIGGSFTTDRDDPADLDALVAYRLDAAVDDGPAVREMARREPGLDLRFVPVDGDPAVAMKVIVFFAALYSFDQTTGGASRPLFIVDF